MKIKLLALAFASAGACHAQLAPSTPITLSGQLDHCADSAAVAVFEPIPGGLLNYYFAENPNEARVAQGRFRYQLHHQPTGLLLLTGKCTPELWVYVEPGTQVAFSQTRGPQEPEGSYTFSGPNAAANNLLGNRKLLNNGPADNERVVKVLASAASAPAVMRALTDLLAQTLQPLHAAYARREISRTCHEYLQASTEQRLVQWVSSDLVGHFSDSARANLHLAMSRAETRRLATLLFARYDPGQPRYRQHDWGGNSNLATLRLKKVLPGPAPTDHTWAQYEKQLDPVFGRAERFDYMPRATRQNELGNTLLYALALKAMGTSDFAALFADYVREFPTSPYNAVIVRYLQQEAARAAATPAQAASSVANQSLGVYAPGAKTLTFAAAPGLDTVRTLSGLVRSQRPGRAVFVDFWATWCAPCLSEFGHELELHKFLTDNNIDALYVSVDKPTFREKWLSLVREYRLQGYHYLAPPDLQKALEKNLPYIPRYLLFDKNGRLADADLPRPSEGEKLYQRVRERLK